MAFTTSEGTWISLDVGPDGGTIVFELLGDLYSLAASGGQARPVLSGRAFQSQPRYSPDGRSIAFVSDENGTDNIWIADAGGARPRRLTDVKRAIVVSPEWARDGRAVFATVVTDRIAELWRFDATTGAGEKVVPNQNGTPSLLVSTPAPGPYSPHAAPDGRWLYYSSVTPSVARSYVRAQSRVMRRDLVTGMDHPVSLPVPVAMRAMVSPDAVTVCPNMIWPTSADTLT